MADLYGYPTFYNPREGYAQSDQAMLSAAQTPVAAPSVATPQRSQNISALEGFIDWPTYLSRRPDVDPADAYKDYVTVVAPNQLVAMGATPEQVMETQTLFQQRVKPPIPKPKELNIAQRLGKAFEFEGSNIGRQTKAGIAVVQKDAARLAELSEENTKQQEEERLSLPSQARFREQLPVSGSSFPEFVTQLSKAAWAEPEGAIESTLQLATNMMATFVGSEAVGAVAGKAVGTLVGGPIGGSLGSVFGGNIAMGLAQGVLDAGAKGMVLLQQQAVKDGVDLTDAAALTKWLKEDGVKEVFGKATDSGVTVAMYSALAGAIWRGAGVKASALLLQGEKAGVGAARNALRREAMVAEGAGIAGGVTTFTAASAAGDIAAGFKPDEAGEWANAVMMLVPAAVGVRSKFASKPNVKPTKPVEVPKVEPKVASDEAIRKMLLEEEPKKGAKVAGEEPPEAQYGLTKEEQSPPLLDRNEKPYTSIRQIEADQIRLRTEQTKRMELLDNEAKLKVYAEERGISEDEMRSTLRNNFEATIDRQDRIDEYLSSEVAANRRLEEQAKAATVEFKYVTPERVTPEQIEAIKPFDEALKDIPVEDKAVAVAVVQDVAKEALNEHVAEVTKQVETEVQARKAKRQATAAKRAENKLKREAAEVAAADIATATPDTTGIVTVERGVRPAEDAGIQQNVVGEVATGPVDRGRTGVIEESVYAATGGQPRGDQQSGRTSRSGEAVVGKQVILGVDVGGEKPVVSAFRTKEEAIKAGNPLYAGREATEAANRKTQKEIDDALRSEQEGDFIPTWSVDTSSPGGVRLRPGFPQAVETVLRAERVTGEQMMGWYARRSDNAGYRTLAQVMLPSLKKPVTIRLMDNLRGADGKSKRGYADSAKREIVLDRKYGLDQETLFHELTHIMTVDGVMNPKTLSQRSAAAEMNKLYEEARANTRPENFTNAFLNIREFLAESHANKGFQDHLVTIRDKFGKNLWDKFKEIWNRFWGNKVPENMLEEVLRVSKGLYGEGKGKGKDFTGGGRVSARPFLNSSEYFYHAVRNDADIAAINKEGLRPGSNISVDTRGQAFNEGETVLVFRKSDYKTSGKGYQEDHTVLSGNGKPVAILKDTETFHRTDYDTAASKVEVEYEAIQKEADLIAHTLGIPVKDFWTLAHKITRYGDKNLAKEKLGEWYERAAALNKREDRLYSAMDRMPEPGAKSVGPEEILSRYDEHGLPVAGIKLEYDEKTGTTTVKAQTQGKKIEVDFAENDQQNLIAFKAMEKDGPGDVVGRKGGVITHRGWDNGDGTYRVYEVKPGGDPRGETPKQVVEAENLKDFFTNAGAEIEIRNLKGFDRPPGNESDLITRWQEGRLVYGAVQMPNGTWRTKVGDDIQTRTAEYKYKTYDTKAEAEAAGNEISTFESKEKSEAAQANSQLRNLVEANTGDSNIVTVGDPNMVAHVLFDRNAAINYVGGATDNWLKKRNINVPEGMKLSVEYMLRNSDVGYQTQDMMKTQGEPLLHKTRQMMKSSPLLEGKDGPAMLDNIVRYLVVRERQSKLLPKYTEEAKWNDPADHSKGRTKFYERGLQKQQKADDFLNDLNTKDPTLAPQVLRHLVEDWKPFSDATIDLEYQTGRITKATADAKKAAYLIYAPLREQGKVTGKTATGQSEGGSNLLQQVVEQRVDAILKGVDNKAMNLLDTWMGLLDYRNEDGTKIFLKEPVDREHLKHDPVTKEITVTSVINPNKSVVWYKDGVPIRLEVNNDKMLKALDRFHGEDRNVAIKKALATAGFYTRTFSTLHTSLSLPFAPRNFVRDYLVNNVNLDPRISYLTFNKAMFDPAVWEAAFRHGYRDAISITGADPFTGNTAGAALARRVEEKRPLIEHKYQYGADLITTEASTALRPSIGSRIAEYLAPSNGKLMNFISGLTHSLEAVNRIAVFKAAEASGINSREAAVLAKRATTNFEQRGSAAPYLNPLFSFSGAKMSGARTLLENIGMTKIQGPDAGGFKKGAMGLVGGKIPESANSRTVHAAQFAIALGLAGAYMSYKLSEKDKDGRTMYGKRSDYQLDNYLRIPGINIDIPMPQEVGVFYVLGSSMGDALWGDRAGKAAGPAMRFTTSVINNFNPGGTSMHDPVGTRGEGGDYITRLILPTPVTPLYDISRNIDSFGTPVNSQRDSKTIPPEMQGAATASPFANAMAQGLHKTGIMDTSPKAVDHIIKSLFGQQKGTYNAILDGNVGALVNEVFKSFRQDVFKGTNKNDFEAISKEVIMDATRAKGNKLKKGEGGPMVKNFEDAERQLDKLKRDWNKASDPETKKRIDEKQDDVRQNALRRYYEATGVVRP